MNVMLCGFDALKQVVKLFCASVKQGHAIVVRHRDAFVGKEMDNSRIAVEIMSVDNGCKTNQK
jgi:hypothetical protein